jgi:hypothetical protein
MHRILRENGLSIVLVLLTILFLTGQIVAGMLDYNEDQREHGQPEVSLVSYLATPHFVEATTENWESEFLQMFAFVVLTACLFQKGSAESKKLDEEEPVDRDPCKSRKKKDGRPGAHHLPAFVVDRFSAPVSRFVHTTRDLRRPGIQRGSAATRKYRPGFDDGVHQHFAILVRVVPELAERVPLCGGDGRAQYFPATERFAGIKTGGQPSQRDG